MRDLNELAILARIAARLSFEAAARDLGISASTVSRKIAALEKRLGVPLVQRTTRSVRLTAAGVIYADHCRAVLDAAERAEAVMDSHREGMQGALSINAPMLLGRLVLAPIVSEFALRHPAVQVRFTLSNARVDLAADDVDLVFRTGPLPDSGLRVRKVGSAPLVIVASAACISRHGTPITLADVVALPCLALDRQGDLRWAQGAVREPLEINTCFIADDVEVLRDAAISGLGFAFLPRFAVAAALADGRLAALDLDTELGAASVWMVFPGHKVPNRCASAFADLAVDAIARDQTWLAGQPREASDRVNTARRVQRGAGIADT